MTSALAAISRLDDGTASPADRVIADRFDAHASTDWHRRLAVLDGYDADRCQVCGKPGEGDECDSCYAGHDLLVERGSDV
ncbi:MAG: hypothetical protein ABW022_07215 [Actinoplanes sp.]